MNQAVNYKKSDASFKVVSWLIIAGLVYCSISMFFTIPTGFGPVGQILGPIGAQYAYALIYGFQAAALACAELLDATGWRKHIHFIIYLTLLFTTTLSIGLTGWNLALLDNVVIMIASSVSWLYWKFRVDYVNDPLFKKEQ